MMKDGKPVSKSDVAAVIGTKVLTRSTQNRPDDSAEPQLKVWYVLPSDGVDEGLDTSGAISRSVAVGLNWMRIQTGGRTLRMDTYNGDLDIGFFRMAKTDAQIAATGAYVRDEIEAAMDAAGLTQANRLDVVYYGGSSTYSCGGGSYPPALVGSVGALYLKGVVAGYPACGSNSLAATDTAPPGYWEFAWLHEMMHVLGLVASCAPHQTLAGHVNESPIDLMYSGPQPWRPSTLDLNHDDYFSHGRIGCADLAWATYLKSVDETNALFAVESSMTSMRHRDLNGDGKDDIVWSHIFTGGKLAWIMSGASVMQAGMLLTDPAWSIARYGDFNGDGRTDLLWRNNLTGQVVMWLMNGTSFMGGGTLLTDPHWMPAHTADFNGDGKADVLWRNTLTGEVVIWLMNGMTVIGFNTLLADLNWIPTHIGDFDGDGKHDIVWRNSSSGQTVIWLMNGTTFAGGGSIMSDPTWMVTHTADFNGDDKADILWRNTTTGFTALWLMNGASFSGGAGLLSDPNWTVVGVDDLNGDGMADILWRNTTTGNTAAWLMSGTTLIGGAGLLGPTWRIARTADMNGDGKADILWVSTTTGQNVLWLMNGLSPMAGYLLSADSSWSIFP